MPATRIPGLTPVQQDAVRAKLAERLGPDASLDDILPAVVDTLHEALPRDAVDVAAFVGRLQAFSDELRRDGRSGMARDLDRLAGVMRDLAHSQHEARTQLEAYRYAATAPTAEPSLVASRLTWAAAQDRGRALAKAAQARLEASFAASGAAGRAPAIHAS